LKSNINANGKLRLRTAKITQVKQSMNRIWRP